MIPKSIAESGEKKRSGFASHASESKKNPSDDPFGRGFHHDVNDGFPTANTKRKRGFAVAVWHKKNDFLRRSQNQRNHDESERESAGIRGETFKPQDHQTVNDDAPHNRRNAVEHVSQ